MGRRVILRKRFIRFADFVRHRLWVAPCDWHVYTTCLIISPRGILSLPGHKQQTRRIWAERLSLLSGSPVNPAWHSKFGNLAHKLLWPLLQWACIFLFQTYGQKTKCFFSLFVCHRCECQAENVTRSSKVLPKLSELDSME